MNIETSISEAVADWTGVWPLSRQGQSLCSTSSYLTESTLSLVFTLYTITFTSTSYFYVGNNISTSYITSLSYVTSQLDYTLTEIASSSTCKSVSSLTVNPTSVIAAVGLAVGLAAGLGAGLGPALQNAANGNSNGNSNQNLDGNQLAAVIAGATGALTGALTGAIPVNDVPFVVPGQSLRDDLCGDAGARTFNETCLPVLKRGPCPPLQWVTVNPQNLSATCRPRLCGKDRVYVASDGLCHDVNDALECSGGRRFYYSAYGDPICDCPIGQYPFPGPGDRCVPLFTQGPCPAGRMVTPDSGGTLSCRPVDCPNPRGRQLVRFRDGRCYQLGSRGPCSRAQKLAFDVIRNETVCADVDEQSPYFLSRQESAELERNYNQQAPFHEVPVVLIRWRKRKLQLRRFIGLWRKQDDSGGIFQLPTSISETLLVPCRPGARNGNNFKCTNPLVPAEGREALLQAVRPGFTCSPGQVLTALAACRSSSRGANCGPSYQFNEALGQCRQILSLQ